METKANFILIGAATLVGLIALLVFSLWISRFDLNRQYDDYTIVFDGGVSGLTRGAEVHFNGLKVGEVTELRLNPNNERQVLARIRVEAGTPVRKGSFAQLQPVGLTGVNLVRLQPGPPKAPLLVQPEEGPPPVLPGRQSRFDELFASGGDIAAEAEEVLARANRVLSDDNIAALSRTIANIETISASLAEQRQLARNANAAIVDLGGAARSVGQLARTAEGQVTRLGDEASMTLTGLNNATAVLEEQSLPDFAQTVQDIRRLTDAVESLTVRLNRNPTLFVSGEERPVVEVAP